MSTARNVAGTLILASVALGAGLLGRRSPFAEPPGPAPAAVAALQAPQPQPQPRPPQSDRTLKLEVVDAADNTPLAGAAVLVRVTRGQAHTSQGTTDDEGRFPIALSADTTYFLHVVAAHPGFVPIELRLGGAEIPDAYTLALPRGATIGGVVRDEQGRPIAGARVFPSFAGPGPGRRATYASMGEEVAGVLTDAEGRWRSEGLPATAGPDSRLDVRVHPSRPFRGRISDDGRGGSQTVERPGDEGRHGGHRHGAEPHRPAGRRRVGRVLGSGWLRIVGAARDRRAGPIPHRPLRGPGSARSDADRPGRGLRLGHPADHCDAGDAAAGHQDGPAQADARAAWSIRGAGRSRRGRRFDRRPRQRGARLGGRDRRRRPVRLVRGAGHRHGLPRCLQGAVPAGAGPTVRSRVGGRHDHPAPPAASARHGHRRRDRPADRAIQPGHRLGPERPRRPAGVAPRQPEQQDIHRTAATTSPTACSPTRACTARSGSRPTATCPASSSGSSTTSRTSRTTSSSARPRR